ncbi:MAG TPA: HAD family acid phosphatase [Arenimonas sp.]|nr:HAD family acid phosphatase [Arenimonas sp.]
MHQTTTLGLALLLTLGLTACQTAPTRQAEARTPEAPVATEAAPAGAAAHDNINALAWMQQSLEYRLLATQIYRAADAQLGAALADPDWDALVPEERANPARGLPPAVIVDIDETVLDNSPYQARLVRDGASYDDFTWSQWVEEERAAAVPGAVEFLRAAAARDVTVFYISNRVAHLNEATVRNLRQAGFPVDDHARFLGLGHFVEGCEQHGSEKGCRRQLVGRTHRVLMQFGDQIGDMLSILANTPDGREQAIAPYRDWFGQRWFVLPNPTYGSWEPALFDNAWHLPEAERRQRKLDKLRYD